MRTAVAIVAVVLGGALLYFISSGLAIVLMYKIGAKFPSRAATTAYAPMEWLARRSALFRGCYSGLHKFMYRLFVGELVGGWLPPPPSLGPIARDSDSARGQ